MFDPAVLKEHVWDSTRETFETMICLPVEQSSQSVDFEAAKLVICIITFTGTLEGAFSARCTIECAEKMAKAMLMMGPEDDISEEEICDALGEVVNMLVGGLKTRLDDAVPDFNISIPSVVKGLDIEPTLGKGAVKFDVDVAVDGEPLKLAVMHRAKE